MIKYMNLMYLRHNKLQKEDDYERKLCIRTHYKHRSKVMKQSKKHTSIGNGYKKTVILNVVKDLF